VPNINAVFPKFYLIPLKVTGINARFSQIAYFSHFTVLPSLMLHCKVLALGRLRMKCDGTRAKTRFLLSAKGTSPFKSVGASVQSTTGSRGVRISGSNAGYTMFRVSVKCTGYPLHSPVSPSLPLPCVTVCRHVSTPCTDYPGCIPGLK